MLLCWKRSLLEARCAHKEAGDQHNSSMMQQPLQRTWPGLLIRPHTLQLAGAWLLQRICKQCEASHYMRSGSEVVCLQVAVMPCWSLTQAATHFMAMMLMCSTVCTEGSPAARCSGFWAQKSWHIRHTRSIPGIPAALKSQSMQTQQQQAPDTKQEPVMSKPHLQVLRGPLSTEGWGLLAALAARPAMRPPAMALRRPPPAMWQGTLVSRHPALAVWQ